MLAAWLALVLLGVLADRRGAALRIGALTMLWLPSLLLLTAAVQPPRNSVSWRSSPPADCSWRF